MFQKFAAIAVLTFGVFVGAGAAYAPRSSTCCSPGADCCNPPQECCVAVGEACCSVGLPCCEPPQACCVGASK